MLATIAALCLALSGCFNGGGAAAKENLGKASGLAHDWRADATLQAAYAIEIKDAANATRELEADRANMTRDEIALSEALLKSDDAVGDGRAPAWLYAFATQDASLVLVLDPSGHVTYRNETLETHQQANTTARANGFGDMGGSGPSDRTVLTEVWKIDSNAAADRAAAHNATFGRLKGNGEEASALLIQGPHDKHPSWILFIRGHLDGHRASAAVLVDANNGTVSKLGRFGIGFSPFANYTFQFLSQEAGDLSASPNAAQPTRTDQFRLISNGHQELRLALIGENGLPFDRVTATITDPAGAKTTMTVNGAVPFMPSIAKTQLKDPQAGTYQVEFHLDQGPQQSVRLDWCTDGFSINFSPFGSANEAC